MKVQPVGAELFHADGQTDLINLIVSFRNSAKAPKNACSSYADMDPPLLLNTFLTTSPPPTATQQHHLLEQVRRALCPE
jgi:hypothetical protein